MGSDVGESKVAFANCCLAELGPDHSKRRSGKNSTKVIVEDDGVVRLVEILEPLKILSCKCSWQLTPQVSVCLNRLIEFDQSLQIFLVRSQLENLCYSRDQTLFFLYELIEFRCNLLQSGGQESIIVGAVDKDIINRVHWSRSESLFKCKGIVIGRIGGREESGVRWLQEGRVQAFRNGPTVAQWVQTIDERISRYLSTGVRSCIELDLMWVVGQRYYVVLLHVLLAVVSAQVVVLPLSDGGQLSPELLGLVAVVEVILGVLCSVTHQ